MNVYTVQQSYICVLQVLGLALVNIAYIIGIYSKQVYND